MTKKNQAEQTSDQKEVTKVTKSEQMRQMYNQGLTVGEIAKQLGVRYQFVYGVISKTGEIRKQPKESKSDLFRQLYDQGLSIGEIAKQTNSNYTFVYSVIKKYKATKGE